ncbi:radical SAM protein, partial [bacterium]|nr:radical SAM protein [bacterium]
YSRKAEVLEETPADVLYTSRGCPYNCAFCSSSLIWKRTYSKRNGNAVTNEIEHLINKYKSKAIIFREDNFTCNKEHVIDICRNIISRKINIPWECESRIDNLSPDIIAYMAKAGCRAMWFGIESGSPKILNQILKGITLSQARNVFKLCKEAGIRTGAAFMLGFPNENIEDIIMTRDFALELNADITYFAVYVGFPFSSLYKYFLNNKLIEFKYRDVLITRNENFSFRQLQIMERKMQSYMNFHKSIRTSLRSPKLFLNGIFKIIRHPGAVRNFFKYFL